MEKTNNRYRYLSTLLMTLILSLSLVSFVFAAPTASAGSPQTVSVGSTVSFDGSGSSCSSCSITSYNWNFGDNSSATGSSSTHSYSSSGVYTATLVVISNNSEISSDTVAITVQSSDTTSPTINHTAVTDGTNGSSISVSATVTDNVLVSSVTLYYRNNASSGSFSSTSLTASGTTYSGSIPASVVNTSGVNYYLSAVDSASNSASDPSGAPSSYYNISISATDTLAPTTFLVSVEGDTSSVYWDTSNNSATSMVVSGESGMACRYATSDSNYSSMSSSNSCTISSSQGNCTVSSLSEANYTYYVSCKDSSSNEQNTSQNLNVAFGIDFTAPGQITSITATPAASKTITLAWTLPTDSISGVSSQKIYRNSSLLSTTSATATSYADTNTTDGQTYTYQIRGVDAAGNTQTSGTSAVATADGTVPTITDFGPTATQTSSSATLTVTTNENSTCRYGTSNVGFASMSNGFSATGQTIHNQSLAVVDGVQTYYVSCSDTAGNPMTTATNVTFEGSLPAAASSSSSSSSSTFVTTVTPAVTTTTTTTTTTPTPVLVSTTTDSLTLSINEANTAISGGDLTTATTLLTQAITSANTLLSESPTTEQVEQTTTSLVSATTSAASLITANSTTNAALVLSDISTAAKTLAIAGDTSEASEVLSAVSTQAKSLLDAGATDAAEAVLDASTKAGSEVVKMTSTSISGIKGQGLDVTTALGLSDLGLTEDMITAAVGKKDEASSLVAQSKRTSDLAEKQTLLTRAQELQAEYLAETPEIKKVRTITGRSTTSSTGIDRALEVVTNEKARAALTKTKEQTSSGGDLIVNRELNTYTITNKEKTSESLDRSTIKLVVSSEKHLTDVTVVETIPKSIASDASELAFLGAQPIILQADPIVSWSFDSIAPGETKDLSYVVKKNVETLDDVVTLASGSIESTAPIVPANETEIIPVVSTTGPDAVTIIAILAVLAIAAYFFLFKGKKNKLAPNVSKTSGPKKKN